MSTPKRLFSSTTQEPAYFYSWSLELPRRFWLAFGQEYKHVHINIKWPCRSVEPVLDLKEYKNASPPILGSMMNVFGEAGLRVRLPGEVISFDAILRTAMIKTIDGIEVMIEEADVSIQSRYYEIEGRVVDSTRLRAYNCQPLPDDYSLRIAGLVIEASMEEKFWKEPSPSPLP